MNTVLKVGCIGIYLLALASMAVEIPHGSIVRAAAGLLLVAHALEVLIAFKFVERYDGPLAVSVALNVLFGFLHWIPLARQQARATECIEGLDRRPTARAIALAWSATLPAAATLAFVAAAALNVF